jgi:hypothetical protein
LAALLHLVTEGRRLFNASVATLQQEALADAEIWTRDAPGGRGETELAEALQAGGPLHDLFYSMRPEFGYQTFWFYTTPDDLRYQLPAIIDYACDHLGEDWPNRLIDAVAASGIEALAPFLSDLNALSSMIGAERIVSRPGIWVPRRTKRRRELTDEYARERPGRCTPKLGRRVLSSSTTGFIFLEV